MRSAPGVLTLALAASLPAAPAAARAFEGEWIGALLGSGGSLFLRVRIGGEGGNVAGRADIPVRGELGILLQHVEASDPRLAFEIPGNAGNLRVEGELTDDGRIAGTVAQRDIRARVELVRLHAGWREALRPFLGTYRGDDDDDVLLFYEGPGGPAYVDYRTGRTGLLFATAADTFVAGSSVLSGYPVETTAHFSRDPATHVMTVSWTRAGAAVRTARRAAFYRTEPVAFASADGTTLSGTLRVPNGPGPHPAAVLVQGSGRVSHTALLPLADPLARSGIAVLLHDRRGVGESGGSFARATFDELADDALAGVRLLARRPDIAPSQIGLVGSSLGGWVAPLAASRSPAVSFVILEAAPAVTLAEHERMRVESQMRADGRPKADIERALAFMDRKFEVARTGDGWPDLERLMAEGTRAGWLLYTNPPTSLDHLRWNGTHVFPYDPRPALAALRVPVLLLYGALDRIVPPATSRERIETALRGAGNRDVTVRVLDAANHNFYSAASGAPAEAPGLAGFVPEYFELRTAWLRERLDERRPVAGMAPEDAAAVAAAETAPGAGGADPSRPGADSPSGSQGEGVEASAGAPGRVERTPRRRAVQNPVGPVPGLAPFTQRSHHSIISATTWRTDSRAA